jgi:hypothetical protein
MGALCEYSASGGLQTLASFNGTNGSNPDSALIMDGEGNFYGTTAWGGSLFSGPLDSGDGVFYEANSGAAPEAPTWILMALGGAPAFARSLGAWRRARR